MRKLQWNKQTRWLGANILCLLLAASLIVYGMDISRTLLCQQAAQRWAGENEHRFAQISAFFSAADALSEADVETFRVTLDGKLIAAGVDTSAEAALWTDAYSCTGTLTISGTRGSATADAIGVGGDYFIFHPLMLRDGAYISGSDLMQDKVVLDEELAWKLFGGVEVAGMDITINGRVYPIAGVIQREQDKFSARAYAAAELSAMIYVPYALLHESEDKQITCYELVMPDPVTNFVREVVEEGLNCDTVQNSLRFAPGRLASMALHLPSLALDVSQAAYPYWENAARLAEVKIAVLLPLIALFLLVPIVSLIVLLVCACGRLKRKIKSKRIDYENRDDIPGTEV